ncbi:ribonuclease H [Fusarium mundagurra]|uniref:Ribonuclease H n=1 Tax=Fusarium mundagurra TaxID=1567541 RepID=A0A8H5Z3I0_9HYPO|nr:ribonuclease H [Fusarium mundagurra]
MPSCWKAARSSTWSTKTSSTDLGCVFVLLAHTEPIRLANDEVAQVSVFLTLEVVVANIMCLLIAYVVQGHEDWDLLVGPPWLRRGHSALIDITPSLIHFRAIKNHRKDESEGPQGLAELEEEELIYVDDDTEIKAEVEGILSELHDAIQQATDAYHLSGNEEQPSVKL